MEAPDASPAAALFRERFGTDPTWEVRAPGRVNLVGEHVDYVGLPVLPIALSRAVTLHLRPRDDQVVRVANADPAFGERSFRVEPNPPPARRGDWENYLKAAAGDRARRLGRLRGFDAVLTSDVPVAAGLSSSAALVVATALALETVNDQASDRMELADALAGAERYVGTEGGGMDQAVSLCARAGHASLIHFDPLRVRHLPIPPGWVFVVADSRVKAEKAGRAREIYNLRTRQCADALQAVRRALDAREGEGYPELLARHGADELLDVATTVVYGVDLQRFRHVVTEGERVRRALAALDGEDLEAFGELVDESHASLRGDYHVSTAELDRLAEIARHAGAEGARLTGAGFGGCVVAVCPAGAERAVLEALEAEYYRDHPDPGEPGDRAFVATPSHGAVVRLAGV